MIHFDEKRWDKIKRDYRDWWAGAIDRPMLQVRLVDEASAGDNTMPDHKFFSFYDLSVPAIDVIKCKDRSLAREEYLGDAFPSIWLNFGAGVLAEFLGAELKNSFENQTVWFEPIDPPDLEHYNMQYNEKSVWFNRIREMIQAANEFWGKNVQLGMTDLGGNMDILGSVRPSEKLLMDLFDQPEEVKRLLWQAHDLWCKYFLEFDSVLKPFNHGYTSWDGIFSPDPYYMLQCDFSYMIGPEMFETFVKPELMATCEKLGNSFFHLDGIGAHKHLDSLLEIETLGGVQWVHGAGQPGPVHWIETYKRIQSAGKRLQIVDSNGPLQTDTIDAVIDGLGSGKGVVAAINAPMDQEDKMLRWLEHYV